MEHHGHHDSSGGTLATIIFGVISVMFKAQGVAQGSKIVGVDTYILLPMAHLVSIMAGICAVLSFLFVLYPPLKEILMAFVSGSIARIQFWCGQIKQMFNR